MSSYLPMIVQFFRSKGLSDIAIAGIVGNMEVESGLNPNSYNSNEGAIGFCNWEGSRRTELQQWALNHHGAQETDAQSQIEFLWHELNTGYTSVLHELKSATSVAQAATIFDVGPGGANSGTGFENSSGDATQQRIQYATQWANDHNLPSSATNPGNYDPTAASSNVGGGGGSGGGSLTRADYIASSSLGSLLNQIPALRQLVDKAVGQDWSTARFENAVEDSAWWKQHSQTARAAIVERTNDPASWQQDLNNSVNTIEALAHHLGMPLTEQQAHAIAVHAIFTGNGSDQQWLTEQVSNRQDYTDLNSTDNLRGGMAATVQQLQQMAGDYGMNWGPSQLAQRAQNVLDGTTTIDTYQQQLRDWAKSAFPTLAKQIDEGTTVRQLADPFVQSMSQLLEMNPSKIDLYTPLVRQALQGQPGKDGNLQQVPLWQFEQQVRTDPRWQFTSNANQQMASTLMQIGSTFGFDG